MDIKFEKFSERDRETLKQILSQIQQVLDITWEFTEDHLEVKGLIDEPVYFCHWRSARAGLELFLVGYDQGFKNGRFHKED